MRTTDDIEKDIFAAKRLGNPTNKSFRELKRFSLLDFIFGIIQILIWMPYMIWLLWLLS